MGLQIGGCSLCVTVVEQSGESQVIKEAAPGQKSVPRGRKGSAPALSVPHIPLKSSGRPQGRE